MKARPAVSMLLDARERGLLRPGAPVVESTSGTLGLGLAFAGQALGHPVVLVGDVELEPSMRRLLRAHGVRLEIVDRPAVRGGWQAARLARPWELLAELPGAYWPDQYNNPGNSAGYASLAAELAVQLDHLDILVCSVGTGGHSAGIVGPLRRHWPGLRLIGVDATGSTIFGQPARPRLMRGLGSSIHPRNVRHDAFDEVHWVGPAEAVDTSPAARLGELRQRRLEHRRRGPCRRLGGPRPPGRGRRDRLPRRSAPLPRHRLRRRLRRRARPRPRRRGHPARGDPAPAGGRGHRLGALRPCVRSAEDRTARREESVKAAIRTVRLDLAEPLRISRSVMASRDAVWLSIEHGGVTGHGEAVSSVYYDLDAATLRRRFADAARELRRCPDPAAALESLRAGELAGAATPRPCGPPWRRPCSTSSASAAGRPVHRVLGFRQPPVVATARTIGITSPLHAAAQARALTASGFQVLKVKAGLPDPEEDVERLRVVRDAAPHARLLLDPNGAWTPRQAAALLPVSPPSAWRPSSSPSPPAIPKGWPRWPSAHRCR